MSSWAPVARRVFLPVIGIASILGALALQFAPRDVLDLGSASTGQLVGILALLFLPALTIATVVADITLRRRRRAPRIKAVAAPLVPNIILEIKPATRQWQEAGAPASAPAQRAA